MNRSDAVNQLQQVWNILANDLDEILVYGRTNPSPFAHRTLVRTHFALIEGLSFQLRQVTLATLTETEFLKPEEIFLLKEERYSLNPLGMPEAKDNFQTFLPSLLFSIRSYLKNHGATYQPDLSHHGWNAMRKAIAIRNRPTHPKSESCLVLSDEDLRNFVDAAAWWKKTLLEMFSACKEADDYWKVNLSSQT